MTTLTLFLGWMIAIIIGLFALAVLAGIFTGKIDLRFLISEGRGPASTARFQFLIFTFVIATSLFYIILSCSECKFPDIPSGILALLGISGGSYAVGKGIQAGMDRDKNRPSDG